MQLPPYVLGGAAVAAGICAYWLLKGPSGPRQGAGKTAGNAQARPTRRTSITPSLGRRRATIARLSQPDLLAVLSDMSSDTDVMAYVRTVVGGAPFIGEAAASAIISDDLMMRAAQ